jgi:hypothetical protein
MASWNIGLIPPATDLDPDVVGRLTNMSGLTVDVKYSRDFVAELLGEIGSVDGRLGSQEHDTGNRGGGLPDLDLELGREMGKVVKRRFGLDV